MGQLRQMAGSPGLIGSGAAAAVPPFGCSADVCISGQRLY